MRGVYLLGSPDGGGEIILRGGGSREGINGEGM